MRELNHDCLCDCLPSSRNVRLIHTNLAEYVVVQRPRICLGHADTVVVNLDLKLWLWHVNVVT